MRPLLVSAGVVLAAAINLSCAKDPADLTPFPCSADKQCPADLFCLAGVGCVAPTPCQLGACSNGLVCRTSRTGASTCLPQVDDVLAAEFCATDNPCGNWSYGWAQSLTDPFTLMVNAFDPQLADWRDRAGGFVEVVHNPTSATLGILPAGVVALFPGNNGELAIVRWQAPSLGAYRITATFTGIDEGLSGGRATTARVRRGNTVLKEGVISAVGGTVQFSGDLTLDGYELIEFLIDWGSDESFTNDLTQLEAEIKAQ
jgi:hypothetical protein